MVELQQDAVDQMRDSKRMIEVREKDWIVESSKAAAPLYRRCLHFFSIESLLNLSMTGRLLHFLSYFLFYYDIIA